MLKFAHDIAGGQGNLIVVSFQSPDFEAGVSGWQVTKAGDAEFNSGTFRGEVVASEFAATVTVEAGPYAGVYTIETGTLTDPSDNEIAVIQWLNNTNPATEAPYIAGVSGPGAGNIASVHSGTQDAGDEDAAIWMESANANNGSNSLFLIDADWVQFFSGDGPLMSSDGGSGIILSGPLSTIDPATFAAETWHPMSLVNGWAAGSSPNVAPQYRMVASPPNTVEVIGTLAGASSSSAQFATLSADYIPASQQMVPAQTTSATAENCFIQVGTSGSMSVQGASHTGTYVFHGFVSLDA